MNILYTITSYPPSIGGAQLYLHGISQRAVQEHAVKVISFLDVNRNDWLLGTTLRAQSKESCYTYEGVKVSRLFFTSKEKFKMFPYVCTYYLNKMHSINALAKLIEKKLYPGKEKIDLIHNVRVGREPLSYASYNLARALRVPFIFTPLHHPKWGHWFYSDYQELYRKADCLIALTSYEKELYKRLGVNEKKIFITGTGPSLSEGADPDAFRKRYNLTGNIVLFIGQGFRYKGILKLIQAAKLVFNSFSNVHFVFIGPHTEYSKKLFKGITEGRILHLGTVDLQTKTDALAACDIFCLPSAQESFGAVFLEAWSFEKPVIGLDIPQLKCLIEEGVNGYLVPPSAKVIAARIIALLTNAEIRKKFGKAGKKKLENNFTWGALYKKTIAAYEEVLDRFRA